MPGEESFQSCTRTTSVHKTNMQDARKFAISPKFHKDTLAEGQSDEIKWFLDPVGRGVHVKAAGQESTSYTSFSRKTRLEMLPT